MKKILLTLFISLFITSVNAQIQDWKKNKHLTLVSYNVENLFDTINTPNKHDQEFTPQSKKAWNTVKYQEKLSHLAQVLSDINTKELPDIIGLTEVENFSVLQDLVNQTQLAKAKYKIVLEEGPDFRGIDCGFLYNPKSFSYINHKAIPVSFPFDNNKRTRDILYVKGKIKKDTLHFFINHWSSRRGGKAKSEIKRIQSARVLKQQVDSLQQLNVHAKIIIMGDFNDEPSNNSLDSVLLAKQIEEPASLHNLMYEKHLKGEGSYYYRGNFSMLDQIIISSSLLSGNKGTNLIRNTGYIFQADYICYTQKNGDKSPNRSYGGSTYFGGYSDHFPIYTHLSIK